MATVAPPPSKRQKTAAATKAREPVDIASLQPEIPDGTQLIQFRDADTGAPQGPAVSVSYRDLQTNNLSFLLNSLLGKIDPADRLPYRFYSPFGDGGEFSYQEIIKKCLDGTASTEKGLDIPCRAEAVFKVKPVTRCSATISGHGAAILTASFSPANSASLATGAGDNTARIWDCDTGTPRHTLKGHTGWVLAVAWSPDEGILATGSMDNTVRLWDPVKGTPLGGPLKGHTKPVMSIAWEPYHSREPGRPRLASASKDFTIRIWDAISGHTDMALTGHKECVTCVKWGGNGQVYSSSRDRTVKIWDTAKGTLIQTLSAHAHWVNHVALSTDFVLRTGYFDHKGKRDVPDTIEGKREKARQRYRTALSSSGGVERLVTVSDDCTMFLWEPSKSTKPIQRMHGHQKTINHVAFSADGVYIASAGWDNHVKLWQAKDGTFLNTFRGHVGKVFQCAFSADSRLLVSGSEDNTLKVWDVRSGKLQENLPGHSGRVFAVDWSPDGERVGSGGEDKAVRIWRH